MNSQKTMVLGLAAAFLLLGAGASPAAGQTLLGRNLVVNGDAESPLQAGRPPGWTTAGPFTVATYGAPDALSSRDAGPRDRGSYYFIGGNGTAPSSAYQVIQLPGIDSGAKFYFSGFLGKNYGDQNTKFITLTASFIDANGKLVQEAVLKGPDSSTYEYDMAGGMLLRGR